MKHAWDGYVKYAWGFQELRPVSRQSHSSSLFGDSNTGVTIVDSLDTLYIMGLMEEFKQGRDWVEQNLDFKKLIVSERSETFLEVDILSNACIFFKTVGRSICFRDQHTFRWRPFVMFRLDR